MKVSVIVPTYNRAHQVVELLTALEEQTFKTFETIIVNDGSHDDTAAYLEKFAAETTLDLKVYSVPNQGRAGSRNFGVGKSNGELLVFFDDDTRPNRDSVGHHYQCHLKHSNALVSGPCLYDESRFLNDFNYFRQRMELSWAAKNEEIIASDSLRINGGNFSIRRSHILKAGGFDERLRDKEDFKLAFDFKNSCGGKILYFYQTWVYHDDFKGLRAYIDRAILARLEEQKLPEIEPVIGIMFPERFLIDVPNGMKYRLGKILRRKVLIAALEKILNAGLIKKNLRYKVYDMIITMNVKYLRG